MSVTGNLAPVQISTTYAERQNLTVRMSMLRLVQLMTNGFSKKAEHHKAALALYFNFGRIHKMLRLTPPWKPGRGAMWS